MLSPHAELDDIPRATKAVCLIGDGSRPLAEDVPRVRSARALGAAFVPTQQLLSRYGERALDGEGALAEFDASLIAPAVRDVVFAAKNVVLHAPANTPSPKDLAETLARSADVSQLLSMLDWPGKSRPAVWASRFRRRSLSPLLTAISVCQARQDATACHLKCRSTGARTRCAGVERVVWARSGLERSCLLVPASQSSPNKAGAAY